MLDRLKVRLLQAKRRRLLKRLKEAVMNDRTESARRQILKIQMRGFSPDFLNYVP